MLKIVHIITRLIDGGADENTVITCNHHARDGHDIWLICGSEYSERMLGKLDDRVKTIFIPQLVRRISPYWDCAAFFKIRSKLRKLRPTIVHTHTSKAGIIGRAAARQLPGVTIVHGVHILPFINVPFLQERLYLALERLLARWTDAFISVSDSMKSLCLQYKVGADEAHYVVPSGMDISRFGQAKAAGDILTAIPDISSDRMVLCYMAALEARKQHCALIDSLGTVMQRHPNLHLILAGGGIERSKIEQKISANMLTQQVHLLGYRDDPEEVIAASDICLYASGREGLPRAVVQYALGGKPIIATALPGIERIVHNKQNGYIVAIDDMATLADHVEALMSLPETVKAMGQYSKSLDLSQWSATTMTSHIMEIYKRVIEQERRHHS